MLVPPLALAAWFWWQVPATAPVLEAVSVQPYAPAAPPFEGCNQHNDPITLRMVGCSLQNLVHLAYDLKDYQLENRAGEWTKTDKYVVTARFSAPASKAEKMTALQAVLAQRFGIKVRQQQKDVPGFQLRLDRRGSKLAAATDTGHCGEVIFDGSQLSAACLSGDDVAEALQYFVDRDHPIVNQTGLPAEARFQVKLEAASPDKPDAGPSIFSALPDQLGLELKSGKVPERVTTLLSARKPTAN